MTSFCFAWVAVSAATFAAALPVHAADPNEALPAAPQGAPAQKIAIDPRTGMLAAAPPAASTAMPGPAVRSTPLAGVRLQSGATRVDLQGRYQMAVVAHRGAAGTITTTCEPASGLSEKRDSAAAPPSEAPREK